MKINGISPWIHKKRTQRLLKTVIMTYLFCFIFFFSGCEQNKERDNFIQALIRLDDSTYAHQEIDPGLRQEIEEVLHLFEDDLKEEVTMNEELGLYYKRLGMKYLELAGIYKEIDARLFPSSPEFESKRQEELYVKMKAIQFYEDKIFTKAYESFTRAIELDSGNPLLYYYTGVCAGWIGKSFVGMNREGEKRSWFSITEASYKRAIEIDPGYVDALYGYSVLLVMEQDREAEAIPYLKKILEKEKKHSNALFLLGRVYYQGGDLERALDQYDRIIDITTSDAIRNRALELKNQIKDELHDMQ